MGLNWGRQWLRKHLCDESEEKVAHEEAKVALLGWALVEVSGSPASKIFEGNGRVGK